MSTVNLCAEFTNLPFCRPHVTVDLLDHISAPFAATLQCGLLDNGTMVCLDTDMPGAVVERGAGCVVVWTNPRCECDRHTLHEVPGHALACRHDVVVGVSAGALCYVKVKAPCRRLVYRA